MKDVFEELIQTIEKNAVDNQATITNVKLWANSWRIEYKEQMIVLKRYAVIIRHPFRDSDWRVDIHYVDADMKKEELYKQVMSEMLGPFEVVAITDRTSFKGI